MSKVTRDTILQTAGAIFAQQGAVAFSIRTLAKKLDISPSLIYYYFESENDLLLSMFHFLNKKLGEKRAVLATPTQVSDMLEQRIAFQIENQETIVAVLKYYLHFRETFPKHGDGFLPDKSALHIEEVLKFGQETNQFTLENIQDDAKVITHLINGYLLEFYPYQPTDSEKKALIKKISSFVLRAVGKKKAL